MAWWYVPWYFIYIIKGHCLKADVNPDIPLETAAIFFLADLYLKQGIISQYVMVNFFAQREPRITKLKILAHSGFGTRDFLHAYEAIKHCATRSDIYRELKWWSRFTRVKRSWRIVLPTSTTTWNGPSTPWTLSNNPNTPNIDNVFIQLMPWTNVSYRVAQVTFSNFYWTIVKLFVLSFRYLLSLIIL